TSPSRANPADAAMPDEILEQRPALGLEAMRCGVKARMAFRPEGPPTEIGAPCHVACYSHAATRGFPGALTARAHVAARKISHDRRGSRRAGRPRLRRVARHNPTAQ